VSPGPRTDVARSTVPSVSIEGSLLPPRLLDDLLELRVVRGTRTTGRAQLTFVDRTYTVGGSELKLGAFLEITAIEPRTTIFAGTITAIATEADSDGVRAVVTAHDASHQLARERSVTTFLKQTSADAIQAIASQAGLRATTPSSTIGPTEWAWRADSLLGQVDELCEREGWEWIVEGKNTLLCFETSSLNVPASTTTLELGTQLVRFSAEQSGPLKTDVEVRGWDAKMKEPIRGTATTPSESSGFQARTTAPSTAKSLVTRRAVTTQKAADVLAKSFAGAAASVTARGRGLFAPTVQPGKAVTVTGAGPGDGTYYVREVEHVYDGGTMRTSFVAGFRPPTLLTDPWRAARPESSILASGVHSAIVSNVKDPDKLGRVAVTIPSLAEKHELAWARVATPGGGKSRGIHWLPEVNDEVLVAFEDGDASRPVVLGGLFSSKDVPPEIGQELDNGVVTRRALVTRAGHKIELSDEEGDKAYVDIALAGGKVRLHLGADTIDLETKDKPLRIASGNDEIVFDGKGTITIKAKTIKLAAQTDLAIEGVNVKTKATSAVELSAPTATVKADASLKLQSSGIAELAGSLVKIN